MEISKSSLSLSDTSKSLMEKLESGGKWMASAGGVGATLAVALMITAYGTLIPSLGTTDLKDCISLNSSLDALSAGQYFTGYFLLSGVLGLIAGCLPSLIQFAGNLPHIAKSSSYSISEKSAGWIIPIQGSLLVCSLIFMTMNITDVFASVASHTPTKVAEGRKKLEQRCSVSPVQAYPVAPPAAPPNR